MMRLKHPSSTPPAGFRFIDPNTHIPFLALNLTDLVRKATEHRVANKLPIPENFSAVIEDFICSKIPDGLCVGPGGEHLPSKQSPVAANIVNATWAFARTGVIDSDHDASVARAQICINCVMNRRTPGCSSCNGVDSQIRAMRHDRATSYDARLHVCDGTGALLRVQVHFKPSTILASTPKFSAPGNCWLR